MTDQWQYQIRIYLVDGFAEAARCNPCDPAIAPLTDILTKHRATMKCELDLFADYVAGAEKHGAKDYPLYEWTKATIENPAKKVKHLKCFVIYVGGNQVYAEEIADALETALQPMVGSKFISRMSKHQYPRSWLNLMNQS